jgi:hypothetical protein
MISPNGSLRALKDGFDVEITGIKDMRGSRRSVREK